MESKELRLSYTETLIDLAKENKNIVVLEADLSKTTGTQAFKELFPDRFINVGIAEANMVGVASGLSAAGKIPFAATFACFASRRAYDQFFLSANYARLNVKLVGTDPGVTAAFNGGTHMPFEDLALMRVIPGLTIIEPSDPISCAAFVKEMYKMYGCCYLRIPRKPAVPNLYPTHESFTIGTSKVLKNGNDICIIALGALMVQESLKAAESLSKDGISASVIDVLTLKPLDLTTILDQSMKCKAVLTAENHQVIGGLGSAVAEILLENEYKGKFGRVGIQDEFGEVGTLDYLVKRFGLDSESIITKVKELLH